MAEPYIIKMPQLSDTMTEGVVVSWEKQIGDRIIRGDIVATVETDKAIMDVEVFREGFLSGPLAPIDSVVEVGGALGYLVEDEQQVRADDVSPSAQAAQTTEAKPPEQVTSDAPLSVSHEIKMPQLSDTMTEGVVVSWERKVGTKIERGDIVATVETDKAIMDVEVFREGYLSGPLVPLDSVVPVGGIMAYLVDDPHDAIEGFNQQIATAISSESVTSPSQQEPRHRIATLHPAPAKRPPPLPRSSEPAPRPLNKSATPYARNLAAQHQVNLNNVSGSGVLGVITAQDVLRAQPVRRPVKHVDQTAPQAMPEVQVAGDGRPMSAMERAVSHNMTAGLTMPTFSATIRIAPKQLIKRAKQMGVSVTVAIAKACAVAIKQQPTINWCYQPLDKIVERDHIDIGMAVATEGGGLIVPVLRHCELRSVEDMNAEWKQLVKRARQRRLKPEEYMNSTFQISNLGMYGVTQFNAIPMPGLGAILAIASATEQGMAVTITADHRVINGAEAAEFLQHLKQAIEQPDWLGPVQPVLPKGEWDFDVVVIGGGIGGEECARELVAHGLSVAMIHDSLSPGGECLWRGCIPSKVWRVAADRLRDRAKDAHLGVSGTKGAKLNWKKASDDPT